MISSTIGKIERLNKSGRQVPGYRFLDLAMAVNAARILGSQLEADSREMQISPVRTLLEGDIVATNSAMLRHYAQKANNMSITFDSFAAIPPLYVDPSAIGRAFYNLVVNAIKYGDPGTEIHVSPRIVTGKGFAVDIVNYGIGVSKEDVPHIFDPYYRSADAQARRHGAGLGLYIGRVLLEKHGGTLELTSANDPTIFTMFFPEKLKWSWSASDPPK